MRFSLPHAALPAFALACLAAAPALSAAPAAANAAAPRIVAPISDTELTTLHSNVHPLAQSRYDRGAAPASMATGRMMLLLRRSDAQQTALNRYLDELQNPSSPSYRKWLTPATFGATYGISDADLASVKGWLESEGLHIESVPQARNMILFSGTIGALQTAFHTSIHSYLVKGQTHYANAVDPQIPTALAPVVAGIAPMNDFRAQPQHHMGTPATFNAETKRIQPNLTFNNCTSGQPCPNPVYSLYVDPADAATIYDTPNRNLNRNFNAATTHNWDGSGITIGVVGYSNIKVGDVLNYRSAFLNDADPTHEPTIIVDGNDPGVQSDGTGNEALLDTEISSGLAPGAAVNYYTASSTDLQDGLGLAVLRALDDNAVSILSVSYGNCEASLGASGNLQYSEFWEQAASQGITVIVSSGDDGSANCDDPNSVNTATLGLQISGIASTPYNIAVGGTDFPGLVSNFTTYATASTSSVGAPPYYGTALGYIPESTWNDAVVTDGNLAANVAYKDSKGNTNIVAGSGGKSSSAYCTGSITNSGSCTVALTGYPKPAFQQGSLTPADSVRDIPDVSLFAANGADNAIWAYCSDSTTDGVTTSTYTDCQTTGGVLASGASVGGVGGTSASAPAFAGILALVAQSQGGVRLGQANNVIYNLAANHYGTVFHDTTVGNISVPCTAGTPNCGSNGFLTGYDTATGYDLATGLGSVDAAALISAWGTAALTPTAAAFTAGTSASSLGTAAISVPHGTLLTFNVAVSPSASGDVSVTNTSGVQGSAASFSDGATLAGSAAQFTSNDLPGGSYSISAYYGGDATHSGASSNTIPVTIGRESSVTALTLNSYDASKGTYQSSTTQGYGSYFFASVTPYGASSPVSGQTITPNGVATGSVMLTYSGTTVAVPISSIGVASYQLDTLAPGTYSFSAAFSGDASFLASTSPTAAFTVTKGATKLTVTSKVATTASLERPLPGRSLPGSRLRMLAGGAGAALGCVLLLSAPGRRRKLWMLSLVACAAMLGGLGPVGCGGSSGSGSGGGGSKTGSGTYQVTVLLTTDSIGSLPTGSISLSGNGNTFASPTITNGTLSDGTVAIQAVFTVQGSLLASGANTLTASYAGDTNYASASGTVVVTA